MKLNPDIFRMYDIRGIVGKDLDDWVMERLGKAFGTHMLRAMGKGQAGRALGAGQAAHGGQATRAGRAAHGGRAAHTGQGERGEQAVREKGRLLLAVGSDHRESSPGFRAAMIRGIVSTGCDVVDIGTVPTPLLYYAIIKLKADGGAQITGSHNQTKFNGVKFCRGWPAIYGEEVKRVGGIAESGDFEKCGGEEGEGSVRQESIEAQYMEDLKSRLGAGVGRGLKVVVDAGNGMAAEIAPKLLRALGCEVIELYCELDGSFPNHLPDPLRPELMQDLVEKVKETGADLGFAFDGDADRAGVVDGQGNMVASDLVLLLFARDFLGRNPGEKVVFEVKCSQALIDGIKKAGGVPVMWKVGHSLIKAKMIEDGIKMGGELSGHTWFWEDYYGFDDGFYAAGKLVGLVAESGKGLSGMLADVEKFETTPEIDVKCRDSVKFEVIGRLKKHFSAKYETVTVDGVRVIFPEGWGLVRASNTRPSLTLRMEAKTKDALGKIKKEILGELAEFEEVEIPENA